MSEFRLLQTQVETLETIFQDLEKYTHDQGDSSNLSLAIEKRQALEKLQSEIQGETGVLVEKFRARCTMVDPVTNEPRFGPKMLSKVQDILRHFDSIKTRLETSDIIEKIIYKAVLQQQQIDFEKKKKQEIQDQKEQEKIANLKKQQEEKRLAMEQAQTLQFLEEEKEKKRIEALAIVAQQKRKTKKHLRQLEKQQQEEKQRALQEQIDLLNTSVPLGKEGLQQALDLLQTNIPSKQIYHQAIKVLLEMVTKILASPENATFRNIKKENPYYHQDLGQFEGGDMCLIALGFKQSIYHQKILNEKEEELEEEEIEEKEKEEKKKNMIVHKIFLLEEPDLSVDLDAWSEWFDRLKTCKEYLTSLL